MLTPETICRGFITKLICHTIYPAHKYESPSKILKGFPDCLLT